MSRNEVFPNNGLVLLQELFSQIPEKNDGEIYKEPVKIELELDTIMLELGEFYTVSIDVEPVMSNPPTIYWKSLDPNIVNVSDDGELFALNYGSTFLEAFVPYNNDESLSNIKLQCEVIVGSGSSVLFKITPTSQTINSGEKFNITPEYEESENKTVMWESSNPNIATVNPTTGEVTGISSGTVTIIAKLVELGNCVVKVDDVVEDCYTEDGIKISVISSIISTKTCNVTVN